MTPAVTRVRACLICSTSSVDLLPINFKVTCSDSGRTQRASGANPRTPSMKSRRRSRMASSISRAMKIRISNRQSSVFCRQPSEARTPLADDRRLKTDDCLHQFSSHHVQRLLARVPADSFAVAGEISLLDFGPFFRRQSVEHQADWFLLGSAGWSSDSRDAYAQRRAAALANSFGECGRNLAAYGAVFFDQLAGNVRERSFQ